MNPQLSIIIVTFNSSEIILDCLKSLDIKKYQIFVVDNASSDDTVKIVADNFPAVKIIKNSENLGFGKANNIALRLTKTPFSLILNPDATIEDDDIEKSLNHLKNNPQIALASPLIYGSKEQYQNTVQPNGEAVFESHFIVGGVMFMNMENIQKIGLFDEQFFMFAEDCEICDRSIKHGFKNAFFRDTKAFHIGGKSSKKNLRNLYRRFWHLAWSKTQYKKNRKNFFNFVRCTLRLSIKCLCKGIFYFSIKNKESAVKNFALSDGYFSNLIGLKAFDKNGKPRG
jgi:GT2 family glycosyltransferase